MYNVEHVESGKKTRTRERMKTKTTGEYTGIKTKITINKSES